MYTGTAPAWVFKSLVALAPPESMTWGFITVVPDRHLPFLDLPISVGRGWLVRWGFNWMQDLGLVLKSRGG